MRECNGKQREVRTFVSKSDILLSIFNLFFFIFFIFFFKFGLKDWVSWEKWVKIGYFRHFAYAMLVFNRKIDVWDKLHNFKR
jgi:hypothetical protein